MLPWDAILGAEVSRAYKPQPETYTRTADVLDLAIAERMLVAAHNADLRAARDVGLATAFVLRPLEHRQGQASDWCQRRPGDFAEPNFVALARRVGA